jgi:thiol:disulfide interchange protein
MCNLYVSPASCRSGERLNDGRGMLKVTTLLLAVAGIGVSMAVWPQPATQTGLPMLLRAPASTQLLEPEQAFRPRLRWSANNTIEAQFTVAKDYYLYRDQISVQAGGGWPVNSAHSLAAPLHLQLTLPPGNLTDDPTFGKVRVFPSDFTVTGKWDDKLGPVRAPEGRQPTEKRLLLVTTQGCAAAGVCFPPQLHTFEWPAQPQVPTSADAGWVLPRGPAISLGFGQRRGTGQAAPAVK